MARSKRPLWSKQTEIALLRTALSPLQADRRSSSGDFVTNAKFYVFFKLRYPFTKVILEEGVLLSLSSRRITPEAANRGHR